MQKINFSPLTKRRSPLQLVKQLHHYSTAWKIGGGLLGVCIFIGLLLLVTGIILLLTGHKDISGFFWMGGFFILVGLLGLQDIMEEFLKNDRLADFAKANGFIFARDTLGDDSYRGNYFRTRFVRIADMLRTPDTLFFEIGNFRIVGQQERSSGGPTYGYIRIKLPRRLPNMMLASKVAKQDLPLPGAIDPSQRLSLEGNFNDTFTLYAPKEYERDALYVFTPDVMTKFMDLFGNFNSEIVDDEIYFYSARKLDLTSPSTFTHFLETITEFTKKFDHQIDYYSDERGTPGIRTPHAASVSAATNTVANAGQRLKTSKLLRLFYLLITLIILALMAFGAYILIKGSVGNTRNGASLRMFGSLAITIVVVFIIGAIQRWRTRHHR